jgi:RNA polymerase sigma factor for flagellar operon FliA
MSKGEKMTKNVKSNVIKFPSPEKKVRGKKAKEKLIIQSMSLVKVVAKRIVRKTPPNVELDDLVSVGVIGLIDAIEKFDPEKGTKFKTYAEHRIRGSILDELRAQDWVPRSIRRKEKIIEKSRQRLECIKGGEATAKEISNDLKMDTDKVHKMLTSISPAKVVNYDEYVSFKVQDASSITNYTDGVNKNNPFKDVSLRSSQEYILKTMESLTENEQIIMMMYYFESKKLKEISSHLGITESRVSQLHMRAKGKMKDWLEGEFKSHNDLVA